MPRIEVPAALRSMPVRPVRLARTFLLAAVLRVPAFALAAGLALFGAWWILGRGFGAGLVATVGTWSLSLVFALAGAIIGAGLGLATAAERTLDTAESDLRDWLGRLNREDGARLFPTVETARLRADYDRTVDGLFDQSIGRIPMPRLARRLGRDRFRRVLLEDFLSDCEDRGVTTIGFAEVRDHLVRAAIPVVTRPAHMQIRTWTVLLLGSLAAFFAGPAILGLLVPHAEPRTLLMATFGSAAAAVLGIGLPRARSHASPWRFRMGLLIIAAGLVLWPLAWMEFWAADIGMVWIVVLAATVWTFHRGVRLVLLDADRPRLATA